MSEAEIQRNVFKWFKAMWPNYEKSFQASMNGVNLGISRQAAIIRTNMKAQGMCVGQSDIFLAIPRHGFHGKYIELKTLTGKPTQDQLEFIDVMVDQGYMAEICKGEQACKDAIESYIGYEYKLD